MTSYTSKQLADESFTSKFRLVSKPSLIEPVSRDRDQHLDPDMESAQSLLAMKTAAKRPSDPHPSKSCSRCYRLKKKCLRDIPRCILCATAQQECVYTERKVRKRKTLPLASAPIFLVSSESFCNTGPEIPAVSTTAESVCSHEQENIPMPQLASSVCDDEQHNKSSVSRPLSPALNDRQLKEPTVSLFKPFKSPTPLPELIRPLAAPDGKTFENVPKSDDTANDDQKGQWRPSTNHGERLRKFVPRADAQRSTKPPRTDSGQASTMHKYSHAASAATAADEYLATKPIIDHDLPLVFVAAYFNSFGRVHSFISEKTIAETVAGTDFSNGLIVSVQVYMVLAIGCRLFDHQEGTNHFTESFSHKNADSVLDMLDLGITEETPRDTASCNMRILLLVILYNMCVLDEKKYQRLLGVACLLVTQLRYYCATDEHAQLIFWLVYILDKNTCLAWTRPLLLPRDAYIKNPWLVQCESREISVYVQKQVSLAHIRGKVLSCKLGDRSFDVPGLITATNEWHTAALKTIDLDDKWKREQYMHWINMQRYYLLVEIDQIEPGSCASFKPTINYLSSSFASVLGEGEGALSPSKSLVWRCELHNVVKYALGSLHDILSNTGVRNRLDTSLQLGEANCQLQVLTNLLAFLGSKWDAVWISQAVPHIQDLSVCILKNNAILCDDDEFSSMAALVRKIQALV